MKNILESYYPIADIVTGMFGNFCEVAIHDLSRPQNSVVYVSNGSVTGRQVGQTFEHLVKQVLLNKNFSNDSMINYTFDTDDGKKIKSSSALIRNDKDEVIGMFCINYDLSLSYAVQNAMETFLPKSTETKPPSEPNRADAGEVNAIIDGLIDNIIGDVDVSALKRKDNISLIEFMDKKGIFLVKGAMDKVAERLGVSKVTIYSYMDEIRNRKDKEPSID